MATATASDSAQAAECGRAGTARDGAILAALGAASFLGTLNANALGPFLPVMARDLGVGVPLLGQSVTATLLLGAALGLVAGPLADRHGQRRLLLTGLGAVVACALGTALAPTFAALLAVRLTGALGGGVLTGVALAIAGARFAGPAQRRAIGVTLAAATLTPIVGFPLLAVIAERAGWRAAFAALALLGLIALGFAAAALPGERAGGGPFRARDLAAAYAPLLRDRTTLLLLGATAARSLCWLGALTYLGTFFAERHALGPQGLGLVYMIGGGGYFLGSLAAGGRLGRAPLRPLIAASTALMAALFGALFAAPLPAPAAVAALGGATFAYALGWVGLATVIATGAPGGRATAQVLNTSVFSLGAAAGGLLGGMLVAFGGFAALGLGLPPIALVAVPLVWRPARGESGE